MMITELIDLISLMIRTIIDLAYILGGGALLIGGAMTVDHLYGPKDN